MKMSTITVFEKSSAVADFTPIIVSLRETRLKDCDILVGYPGLRNVARNLFTGDALLFETPNDGIVEVRLMAHDLTKAHLLISQVSPQSPGLAVGLVDDDPNNGPFSPDELQRIETSVDTLKEQLRKADLFLVEQLDFIDRTLDDIKAASTRLGRKDWIAYFAGTLTTVCASAAFSPAATRALFESAGAAFDWLFRNVLLLLP